MDRTHTFRNWNETLQAERIVNISLFLNGPFNIWKPDQLFPLYASEKGLYKQWMWIKKVLSLYSGIYLWVLGQADVSWSERLDGRRTHFEYEIYLKDCMTMWGKGKYLFKSTSVIVWPCRVKVSTSRRKGFYDHVGQQFLSLQIYPRDCIAMWGKGLHLKNLCGTIFFISSSLSQGLYDHVWQRFVTFQIYP